GAYNDNVVSGDFDHTISKKQFMMTDGRWLRRACRTPREP
ncbi:MAG: hypothetical protein ACI8W3_002464, partial [Myxococcota bacterium]